MGGRKLTPGVVATLVVLDLVAAALAWRDLKRRSDSQVRGSRRLWQVVILVNPGNALAYWMFGRRRAN